MRTLVTVTVPLCVCVLAAGTWLVSAGDLNPPSGSVAPTMKTLTDVEPRTAVGPDTTPGSINSVFVIDQPGSYYLTGDVVGGIETYGINITASDVTLDLNGFAVVGVAGCLTGINVAPSTNISIFNGTIRNWEGGGLVAGTSVGGHFHDLIVRDNIGQGIHAGNERVHDK